MNAPLPGPLNDNPNLDRWVAFPSPGKVTVLTGRVELGQGVLTAMHHRSLRRYREGAQ
jgi:nicotinate dehydrogenase subunit B